MGRPRCIIPNTTYLLTRRTAGRHFYLRPNKKTNHSLEFILGYAARTTGIIIHEYIFLSNHWHAVVTDPNGLLPEFMEQFHKLTGRCLNAQLGRWESLWAVEPYSAIRLTDSLSQWKKAIYVMANSVSSFLVKRPGQWPGASSVTRNPLEPKTISRPKTFFRENGPVPNAVVLKCAPLPAAAHLSEKSYLAQRNALLDQHVEQLNRTMKKENRNYMGKAAVLAQSPFSRPRTHEPRRNMKPRVAGTSKWRRIEALYVLKDFLHWYKKARLRFLAGEKDVVFPPGTYWYRRYYDVPCAAIG